MEAYSSWVRRNQQWLSSLESIANTLTWLLPERLANSEVAPEAVSTLVGLLTVLNRYIIETTPKISPTEGGGNLGQHLGVVPKQHMSIPWSFILSIVKEFDVLVEVTAEYYLGNENKWTPLAMNEAIKTIIRLLILFDSGGRILLDGGETQNVEEHNGNDDISTFSNSGNSLSMRMNRASGNVATNYERGISMHSKNLSSQGMEARAKQSLVKFGERVGGIRRPSWLQSSSLSAEPCEVSQSSRSHSQLLPRSSEVPLGDDSRMIYMAKKSGYIDKLVTGGEVIFVVRPLIYVLLIRRYGIKSWKPWVSSILLDLAAVNLQAYVEQARTKTVLVEGSASSLPLTDAEKQELKRRRILLALYLFRDPFFSKYTRPRLEYTERLFSSLPLLGFLSEKVLEFLYGIQGFYSYTSGS